tara:strand:- start:2103 stop:2426 length:324 start_codon:yes stop_codon:yes gene_type:complete
MDELFPVPEQETRPPNRDEIVPLFALARLGRGTSLQVRRFLGDDWSDNSVGSRMSELKTKAGLVKASGNYVRGRMEYELTNAGVKWVQENSHLKQNKYVWDKPTVNF